MFESSRVIAAKIAATVITSGKDVSIEPSIGDIKISEVERILKEYNIVRDPVTNAFSLPKQTIRPEFIEL